ncbi:MAG TPA: ComF family protein [Thermoanaerobaculia bacterium]
MQTTNSNALSNIGREALRIVLPSWCVVCDQPLPWRDRRASCCGDCWRSLPRLTGSRCRSCALPLPAGEDVICISCSADPLPVDWCDAWGEYTGGLERLLHAFKFGRHEFLDASLATLLHETRDDFSFDAIVPVPMHWAKERRRGYNQAELLARALGKRTGIACDARLLAKRQENETQSLLARAARRENVRNSFEASPRASGKSILIVDDICTTGETFRACARAFVRAGAKRVCAISVAKAV